MDDLVVELNTKYKEMLSLLQKIENLANHYGFQDNLDDLAIWKDCLDCNIQEYEKFWNEE